MITHMPTNLQVMERRYYRERIQTRGFCVVIILLVPPGRQ
jgi:hypothetical protein